MSVCREFRVARTAKLSKFDTCKCGKKRHQHPRPAATRKISDADQCACGHARYEHGTATSARCLGLNSANAPCRCTAFKEPGASGALDVYLKGIPPEVAREYPYVAVGPGGYMSIPLQLHAASQWELEGSTIYEITTGRPISFLAR